MYTSLDTILKNSQMDKQTLYDMKQQRLRESITNQAQVIKDIYDSQSESKRENYREQDLGPAVNQLIDLLNSYLFSSIQLTRVTDNTSTIGSTVSITDSNSVGTFYPTFVSGTGQGQSLLADTTTTPLTYTPSTGTLTLPIIKPTTITDSTNNSGSTGQILSVTTGNSILWVNRLSTTALTAMLSLGHGSQSAITFNIASTAVNPIQRMLSGSTNQNFPASSGFSIDTSNYRFNCTESGTYLVSLTIPITTTSTYDTFTDFRYNGATSSDGFIYARCRTTLGNPWGGVISMRFNWTFVSGDYFDFATILASGSGSNCSMYNGASISTTRIE